MNARTLQTPTGIFRILVGGAVLLWLCAWGRLIWSTVIRPSPWHDIQLHTVTGSIEPGDPEQQWNCFGSAYVVGRHVWRVCSQYNAESWVRFDLSRARADWLWPLKDAAHGSVGAVAPGFKQGALVVAGSTQGLLQLQAEGGVRDLELGFGLLPCLRRAGSKLERVSLDSGQYKLSTWSERSGWAHRVFQKPSFDGLDAANWQAVAWGCYWESGATPGWRGVWLRHPKRAPNARVDVEVWVGPLGKRYERVDVISEPLVPFERAIGTREYLTAQSAHSDDVLLLQTRLLNRTSGGGVLNDPQFFATPTSEGLRIVQRDQSANEDYVVDQKGLHLIEAPEPPVDYGSAYFLKMLPDGSGGYWLLDPPSFVHLDAKLQRTDSLGFFERMQRALSKDHAKRHFYGSFAWLKKALFIWVLFGLPVLGMVVLLPRRTLALNRRRFAQVAASSYLLIATIAFPVSFWPLSGHFW